MKKLLYSTALLASVTILSGCSTFRSLINPSNNFNLNNTPGISTENPLNLDFQDKNNSSKEHTPTYTIKDFYPFKSDARYIYEGKGTEYNSRFFSVDFLKNNRLQIRMRDDITELVQVLEHKDGELKIVFSRPDCYYREDFTTKASENVEVLLKEPIVKGTSWNLSDGRKRYISNVDVDIATPRGSYKALEITTENKGDLLLQYYALNIGLVKTIIKTIDTEVTSSLSKIENNPPLVQNIRFYYPSSISNKILYTTRTFIFNTNDITKMSLEKAFRDIPSKELRSLFGPSTKIKSLYLNKDNMVYVDFTQDLVDDLSEDKEHEELVLQCIANTLGEYYKVNKVYITVEDKPYSSDNIAMKKGQAITVSTKNCTELKE